MSNTTNGGAAQQAPMVKHATDMKPAAIGSTEFCAAGEPTNLQEMMTLAEAYASIGYCGVKSAPEALARMMTGRSMGIATMQSLRGVFDIDGRPAIAAALLHGICLQSPECEYFDIVSDETDATKATCLVKRRGRPERKFRFTIEQAEAAGLLTRETEEKTKKSNWTKWREDMLVARCQAITARRVFPDRVWGLTTKEEIDAGLVDDELPPPGQPDPNEIMAEIVPPANVQAAKRDYAKEAAELCARARAAKTRAELSAVREDIQKWDGIEPYTKTVQSAYNEANKAIKERAAAAISSAEGSAQASAAPGQVPTGNLFTGTEPAKP